MFFYFPFFHFENVDLCSSLVSWSHSAGTFGLCVCSGPAAVPGVGPQALPSRSLYLVGRVARVSRGLQQLGNELLWGHTFIHTDGASLLGVLELTYQDWQGPTVMSGASVLHLLTFQGCRGLFPLLFLPFVLCRAISTHKKTESSHKRPLFLFNIY